MRCNVDTKILREQIGFSTFAAVGAHDFIEPTLDKPMLSFKVSIRPGQKHTMAIQLNAHDLYDVFCENISEVVYRMCHPIGQPESWFDAVGIERIDQY